MFAKLLLGLFCLGIGMFLPTHSPTNAQETKPTTDESAELQIRVFSIRHADARYVASSMMQLLANSGLNVVADSGSNSIVVQMKQSQTEKVRSLVEILDRPKTVNPASSLVQLDTELSASQFDLLKAWANMNRLNIATAVENRLLLVDTNSEDELSQLNTFLKTLQTSPTPKVATPQSYLVRLLWLRESADSDSQPNEVIQRIGKQLEAIGMSSLQLDTQLACRCDLSKNKGSMFSASTSAGTEGAPSVNFEGMLNHSDSENGIQGEITIQVKSPNQQNETMQFQLQANLVANKYIVLASSPYQGRDSVFVVQLVPSE